MNPTAQSTARFHGFDYLRVAGILAVIYIHGCDTNDVARRGMKWLGFAVPCFFMMSAFLTQLSVLRNDVTYARWVQRKFRRLAPPFFLWSLVYLAVRYAKSLATGKPIDSGILGSVFWGDASHQLYFVPMLFYGFIVWTGIMILAKHHQPIAVVILLFAMVASVASQPVIDQMLPANRWFIAKNLAWFPIGMLVALVVEGIAGKRVYFSWPALIGIATFVLTDFVNVYAVSAAAFLLAISIGREPPQWVKTLAAYSYGVYLVHVLFIEAMQFVAPRFGMDVASLGVTVGITCLAALLSYAVCFLLGRSEATRWSVM